ncbi:MAG: helix-turn-helix domain-containing protein [Thermoguttaceae bacterium]|nr:helix-turn-helix domain-containing protein [Thermoguttaceae bacterium]
MGNTRQRPPKTLYKKIKFDRIGDRRRKPRKTEVLRRCVAAPILAALYLKELREMNTSFSVESTAKPAAFDFRTAARYLGLSEPAFRDILKTGEIPYRKAGRRYLIAPKVLDAWLAGETSQAAK